VNAGLRLYSPEIHQFGDKFNIYFDSLEHAHTEECKSIGVGIADSPTGKFQGSSLPLLSLCPEEWVLNPHVAHDGMYTKENT